MGLSTVFISAYAKAPQNTPMYENNKQIGVMLEIHKQNHIVVNVDATFITALAKDYIKRLIVGTDFSKDISPLITDVENDCIIQSQQALVVALKVAHQKYHDNFL
ncbi:DUF3870 domain-containing protein [Neobacillus vireti]|uniref:DUF3870 domain-containing protein n=1 Tax=Neobacillus vireti LMG 21834 TaxID=1131730 RepID=A0AB94IFH4_9BACI|nr:DUF3870 domain-containing protein [Neobacillus vireti]ETI65862.1 hypothetical protein BAVI_25549 [Neobacillus vireti LMG 21834]KLT18100.1 hypothetical protein AA980_10535 [Neobacillus vireti]